MNVPNPAVLTPDFFCALSELCTCEAGAAIMRKSIRACTRMLFRIIAVHMPEAHVYDERATSRWTERKAR